MGKIYLLIMIGALFIFSGCVSKEATCEPIKITQKCEIPQTIKPMMSDESGDNPTWLKAVLENKAKLESYVYDLEAALAKCK